MTLQERLATIDLNWCPIEGDESSMSADYGIFRYTIREDPSGSPRFKLSRHERETNLEEGFDAFDDWPPNWVRTGPLPTSA